MLTGQKLGRYQVKQKIGSGGMGEVFLGYDEQLDRDLALKVLLPEFCTDDQRVKRFKFEAKAVSALNHPGIITIHEIVEEDERIFIATEFVDGSTLRRRIDAGDLTRLDSISIAEQVADALAAAHDANIVHRDIKPENIMVRKDGYAKVLDFGLAKPKLFKETGTEDETIQIVKTQPGLVMGSVKYMSPEQARGKETDERTDVWSLGVVLYEMLTGENPFEGETISDSLAALIHKDPEIKDDLPPEIKEIIRKALNKDETERYQNTKEFGTDLKEVRLKLESLPEAHRDFDLTMTTTVAGHDTSENKTLIHKTASAENPSRPETDKSHQTSRRTFPAGIRLRLVPLLITFLVTTAAVGSWLYLPALFQKNGTTFDSIQVSRLTDDGKAHAAAVSPDGKLVAFISTEAGDPKLLVRQIATGSSVEAVPATSEALMRPTFSPDGEFIYFVSQSKGFGTLKRVSTLGGDIKEIIADVDSPISFSPDGSQLAFLRHNPNDGGDTVYIAAADGDALDPFINTKDVRFDKFTDVVWTNVPDKLLLAGYKAANTPPQSTSLLIGNTTDGSVSEPAILDAVNKEGFNIAPGIKWLKDDSGIVFIGGRNLDENRQIWHLSFDQNKIKSVTTDTSNYASLSISDDGKTLIADKVDRIAGLLSYSPSSKETRQILTESKNFLGHLGIHQLPGGQILYSKLSGDEVNIFLMDEDGSNERQITKGQKYNTQATSTADGNILVFVSNRTGQHAIWRMNQSGGDAVQLTNAENARDMNPQIANNGKTVLFVRQNNDGGKATLMAVPINGGQPVPLVPDSKTSDFRITVSRDGRSIAYLAFEYDEESGTTAYNVKTMGLEDGDIGAPSTIGDFELGGPFEWSPKGNALTYIKRNGVDNIVNLSVPDKTETVITNFNSGKLVSFTWSNDGNRIFIVRGIMNSDLVLIRDNPES